MISIVGNALYQWDTGRFVTVDVDADHVHFANKGDSKAVVMKLADSQSEIPNYLLQTGKQLCVYAVNNGVTVETIVFPVISRERPVDYVYDEDQRNFIYELIESAEAATEAANQAAEAAKEYIDSIAVPVARLSEVTLLASEWVGANSPYSQVITLDGITEYSKVDLLPSVEQLSIFHHKDLAFVTENEDGVVTVYSIGDKPANDYTMQVQITEVEV